MRIYQYEWSIVDSNSYLIVERDSAILIDAIDNDQLYRHIEHIGDLMIILTHSHFDHISGLNYIRKIKPTVKVLATTACSKNIGNIYRNMSSTATAFMSFYGKRGIQIEPFVCNPVEVVFEDEYTFLWNSHELTLKAFFGHSDDSLIIIIDNKYLFSGDSLLGIPTVTRFPGGNTKRFWTEDIPYLYSINGIERVYPGHGSMMHFAEALNVNKIPDEFRGIVQ